MSTPTRPSFVASEQPSPQVPTPVLGYERLSASAVRVPSLDLTIELSGTLTPSELIIGTDIALPYEALQSFPEGTEIVRKVELSEFSSPLVLEAKGGGGGSAVENGVFGARNFTSYSVRTPLTVGQRVRITALVTVGQSIPVSGEIRLSVELVVEPTTDLP